MELDLDLPRLDDDIILPDVEAFPTIDPQAPLGTRPSKSSSEVREGESSDSAEAPQRKRREPKTLPFDERQELHNSDLANWKTDYVANMAEASKTKMVHKAPSLAKKNAAFWVMGVGIGGVGAGLGSSKLKSPLEMFSGESMLNALTGVSTSTAGQKRAREEGEDEDEDSEARRVRARDGDGEQIGRGQEILLNDDGTMMISANEVHLAMTLSVQELILVGS